MFTGLIQHVGVIMERGPSPAGERLVVDPRGWAHHPDAGASIAISGCCLTIVDRPARAGDPFAFDVVPETLEATTLGASAPGRRVNLEHALPAGGLLGGHIVQGHIDAVTAVRAVRRADGEWRVRFDGPADLMEYVAPKGSIAIDGVSLTIAAVGDDWFEVVLIPTTLAETTLGDLSEGDRVNIETDPMARTVVHWLRRQHGAPNATPSA